jgi:hypothetical protein
MKKAKSSQSKKNKMPLKKQPIKTYIFFAIALVAIIIGFTLITQNYKPFIILLPQEEKAFDSWSLLVRTIEKELGLKRIRLSGYKNFKDLENQIARAGTQKILWAEVPHSSDYPLEQLIEKKLLQTVDMSSNKIFFPASILAASQTATNSEKEYYTLPLCLNPIVKIRKINPSSDIFPFDLVVSAKNPKDALDVYTFFKAELAKTNENPEAKTVFDSIQEATNTKHIQRNAHTFTKQDSIQYFFAEESKDLLISTEELLSFTTEQAHAVQVQNLGSHITSELHSLIFPKTKNAKTKRLIEKSQDLLANKELQFILANTRNWIPAHIATVARNAQTDFIRQGIRQSSLCFIPSLEIPAEAEAKNEFLAQLGEAFRSKMNE